MVESQKALSRRPFFFRFPDDIRERLISEAAAAERTLTAEIIYRLRVSLEREPTQARPAASS